MKRYKLNPVISQVWKNENVSARAQHSYRKWIASLEMSHVEIVKRFQRRMRSIPTTEMRSVGSRDMYGSNRLADRIERASPRQSRGLKCSVRRFA